MVTGLVLRMLAQLKELAPDFEMINDAVILFRGGGCLKDLGHEIILFLSHFLVLGIIS